MSSTIEPQYAQRSNSILPTWLFACFALFYGTPGSYACDCARFRTIFMCREQSSSTANELHLHLPRLLAVVVREIVDVPLAMSIEYFLQCHLPQTAS